MEIVIALKNYFLNGIFKNNNNWKKIDIFLPAIYQQIFAFNSLLKITMIMWFSFL